MFRRKCCINNIINVCKYNLQFTSYRLIDNERPKVHARVFGWTDYFTLEDTYSWLDSIIEANPTILTNYNIGNSFEGRTIRVVKLSHKAVRTNSLTIEAKIVHGIFFREIQQFSWSQLFMLENGLRQQLPHGF